MRGLADLPEDTRPHLDRSALVTVDVQRDVLDGGALEIPGTSGALGNMAELARAFRRSGRPIVHVVRLCLADASNADLSRRSLVSSSGPLLRPDTPGCQIASPLLPDDAPDLDSALLLAGEAQSLSDTEFVVYKAR